MIFLNILENLVGFAEKFVRDFGEGWRLGKAYKEEAAKGEIDKLKMIESPIPSWTMEVDVGTSDKPPTDEDIEKYYARYVNRFKADAEHEWDTEEKMTLEEYSEKAKDKNYGGGWRFLFLSASHCMIGSPFGDGPLIFM